ncbi:MAG: T9SS type A sorting domain-containing protein, partial [Candidatus Eisenbacteria bacterium]
RPGTRALPRFALFGWVSPPRESTTAARYAELAEAGFNLTVLAWEDIGSLAENRARFAFTRDIGVRNLILDQRLDRVEIGNPASEAIVDTIAADYANEPALLGYYLGDEPAPADYRWLSNLFAVLARRDPEHPAWNNLFGRMHYDSREAFLADTRAYADTVKPVVLCNDHYDFLETGDRGMFMENVAGLASVARERGLPFWGIVQLVQHRGYRAMTAPLLSWQVGHWLAYGTRGIGYFTYWTPAPDTFWQWQPSMIEWGSGARTPLYGIVQSLNTRVLPIGETLAGLQWLTTEHAGSLPLGGTAFAPDSVVLAIEGRAAIGTFVDSIGTPYLLVVNSDSSSARNVRLTLPATRHLEEFVAAGTWAPLPGERVSAGWKVGLALDAGAFTLLRSSPVLEESNSGLGELRLSAGQNPARGAVLFAVQGARGQARLELLDANGRRLWLRRVPVGTSQAVWDGRREQGGVAARGVYFARLEDASGVRVRRVVWLGAR